MRAAASHPFAVECLCGTVARGVRQTRAQTVPCPKCQKPLFVFPASRLPPEFATASPAPTAAPWRFWLAPAIAAIAGLAVVGVIVAVLVRSPVQRAERPLTESRAGEQLLARLDAARAALLEGSYTLAAREFDAAHDLHARFPRTLTDVRLRELRRLRRQAALLADLSPESLNEIARHSVGLADAEWRAAFDARYAGRAIVLDARVYRDSGQKFVVDYHLETAGLIGEWDVQAFALFQALPLKQPQRLVFGFRLGDVLRTGRDRWTVRPLPESGVLFTDEVAFAGLSVDVDDDLRAVLSRQAGWAADLPESRGP